MWQLLECINKTVPTGILTHFRDFVATVVCDQEKEECMFQTCAVCHSKFDDTYCFPEDGDSEIECIQWLSVEGKATKCVHRCTLEECISKLREQLPAFLVHSFIKRKQNAHFHKEKVRADGRHAVIQVDFAENYAIVHQNEIQSGHWNHEHATIFTGCAHIGEEKMESYAVVSNDLVHSKCIKFQHSWTTSLRI